MSRLNWNKPERVTLAAEMRITYRDINLWQRPVGKLISWSGNKCRVRWNDMQMDTDDLLSNLYVWTEQETDQRDVFQG